MQEQYLKEHVGGIEVTMTYALAMHISDAVSNMTEEGHEHGEAATQAAALEQTLLYCLPQAAPVAVLLQTNTCKPLSSFWAGLPTDTKTDRTNALHSSAYLSVFAPTSLKLDEEHCCWDL